MRRRLVVMLALAGLGWLAVPASARPSATQPWRWHNGAVAFAGEQQSYNWAGYSQGSIERNAQAGFHSVSGDWVVPTVSPHAAGQSEFSATWLGIGGGCEDSACKNQDQTLIQTGTEQDIIYDAVAGTTTPQYTAWYELVPQAEAPLSVAVNPGDHIHASIQESPVGSGQWIISFIDRTDHQSAKLTVSYQSTYGSAEWIEEAPTVVSFYPLPPSAGFGPLPDLKGARFDNATANGSPAGLRPGEAFQLIDLFNHVVATPSAPDPEADGFGVCSYRITCARPTSALSASR